MGLREGTKLGPYEIVSPLGAGGMGEVYRARDTKLNRDVALKVLPEAFAADPQRMARFEREAQVLASLNHPNIAVIYGLEESGPARALVMEMVEGRTLAERIGAARAPSGSAGADPSVRSRSGTASGALAGKSLEEKLRIARQVAEALEYAHERGVVHRDLKPANVKITPEGAVKVLDFGLAKAMGPGSGPAAPAGEAKSNPDSSGWATVLLPAGGASTSEPGLIVGTAAYMSPEQASGRLVDRRCDIWAFGCVLYEMLAGQKAFSGDSLAETLAHVVLNEPDWNALPEATPPAIRRLITRCLQKDPHRRLRDVGEARITIEETISGVRADGVPPIVEESAGIATGAPRAPHHSLPWALAGLLAVAAAIFAAGYFARAPKPQHVIRFPVPAPENTIFVPNDGSEMSLSPDGREIAFLAQSGSNAPELWVRPLDGLTARRIPGTEGANLPFWSPDGQYIAFFASGKLEKVALSGGPPQTVCDIQVAAGGTWNRDGVILFWNGNGLDRVPATGGTPALVLAPEKNGESYIVPQFLPDGKHFIFLLNDEQKSSVAAGSLGSSKITRLMEAGSNALYAPPGELLYLSAGTLMARPFDAKRLRFTGAAVPVAENVGQVESVHFGFFSVSPSGILAYQASSVTAQSQMAWFSFGGKELGKLGPPGIYECPAISPDGGKIAVNVGPQGKSDIWVYDLNQGTGSRLTFNPADDFNPVWSSNGKQIFFSSDRKGSRDIYEKDSNGLGTTQLVYASAQSTSLDDVSPDGHDAIYDTGGNGLEELWLLPLGGGHKPSAFVQGKFSAANAQFSPKGRYVAYTSSETGRNEVYVQTFPQHAGKWQISTAGGVDPEWGHDGKELYFLDPKNQLMAAAVDTHSTAFQAGIPKPLFQAQIMPPSYWRSNFVVSPDGKRFLMLVPVGESRQPPVTVVVNWTALLKKQ